MSRLQAAPRRRALLTLPAFALAASFASPAQAFQDDGTVRIGIIESQTGQYAAYGLPGLWGTQIGIDEINAAGGVTVDGKKVKIAIVPRRTALMTAVIRRRPSPWSSATPMTTRC